MGIKEQIEEIIEQQLKEDSTQSATYDKILDLVDEFEEIYKQYIDHLEEERDFERRDKIQIVKQFDDPNEYVKREDYIKLEEELNELEEKHKKAINDTFIMAQDYERNFARRIICEEIRNECVYVAGTKEISEGSAISAHNLNEILNKIEKGEE